MRTLDFEQVSKQKLCMELTFPENQNTMFLTNLKIGESFQGQEIVKILT